VNNLDWNQCIQV